MSSLRTAVLAALAASSLITVADASPAPAQEAECELDPVTLNCRVGAPITRPGDRPDEGSEGGGGGNRSPSIPMLPGVGDGGTETDCTWRTVNGSEADQYRRRLSNAPADGAVQICDGGPGTDTEGLGIRIVPEGPDDAPADPADVAAGLLVEARAQMHAPQVVADPPVGTPSIITLPVFVQVTNWVGAFDREGCEGSVCVTLSATPTLTFDPGEPGSTPIVCNPPGTRFDPAGPDPEVQASLPGACAYVYRNRTGAEGRPDVWPGQVTVSWDVSWTAPGTSGDLPAQELSTPVPRRVDEVQTVVRDGAS
jgi:hypothetical protein